MTAAAEYEKVSEGHGEMAGRAQILASDLWGSAGRTSESLIGYYKVLAVYESDTTTELAADALLKISKMYETTGDTEKSRLARTDLLNRYPNSQSARQAAATGAGQ